MKRLSCFFFIGLISLCGACAGMKNADVVSATAPPNAPPAMQLGEAYLSALGESCYKVLPMSGTATSVHGLCLRDGAWIALTPIYANIQQEKFPDATRP